jgi:signal transduction histidine kinase
VLLPAPGFPQTLPGGAWRAFLVACASVGPAAVHRGVVRDPVAGAETAALGAVASDGSVLVLLGGAPEAAAVAPARRLLPLVAAAVRGELAARAAAGQAALARGATTRAEALTDSLDRSRHDLEAALRRESEARGAAEAALRARDEFLSLAAHELKTPVTSLLGVAQLNARRVHRSGGLEPGQVQDLLRVFGAQTLRLRTLIEQLLDVSRIHSGKLALDRRPTDLVAVVSDVVQQAVTVEAGERHNIRVVAPPEPGALVVQADALRLEQVFTNLLGNAVKYSPAGAEVVVRLERPAPDRARVEVRDSGIGVPPERRAHIFDRFYQAHGEGHFGGMGLGLYVSKQIVEQHGGTIAAEFPEEGGSCFVVTLPA